MVKSRGKKPTGCGGGDSGPSPTVGTSSCALGRAALVARLKP